MLSEEIDATGLVRSCRISGERSPCTTTASSSTLPSTSLMLSGVVKSTETFRSLISNRL